MPIFLMTLLRSVHFYIYIALFSVVGTLYFMNSRNVNKVEKLAAKVVEVEREKLNLERKITRQNDEVAKLKNETAAMKARVSNQNLIISILDEEGKEVLLELDEQAIPKEHRGALMWMIQKSMEELKK